MIGEARLDHGEGDCLSGGARHTYIYGEAQHSVDRRRASFWGAGDEKITGGYRCAKYLYKKVLAYAKTALLDLRHITRT